MRYEAGANGYRILPITEEEFAIMMTAASRPKNGKTNKFVSASKHHQPQPIFPKSKEKNRSPIHISRAEEQLHPKSFIPATTMESSKKHHGFTNLPVSKEEGGASSRETNSSLEEKAPPIIPAFLRPKVRNCQLCRLYRCEDFCDSNFSLPSYGITAFW